MKDKRLLLLIPLVLALTLTAYAAGTVLKLDSSKPMQGQIEEFKEWYQGLGFLDRASWDLAFYELTGLQGQQDMASAFSAAPAGGTMVWIPKSGSKYHSRSSCSNMRNPGQVTLDEAIRRGYDSCSKCH